MLCNPPPRGCAEYIRSSSGDDLLGTSRRPTITCSRGRPRRHASAGIDERPSGWTISSASAPAPQATHGTSPGSSAPIGTSSTPATGWARRTWSRRPSIVVQAPGHGWSARTWRSISTAGRRQSIHPSARVNGWIVGRGALVLGRSARSRREPSARAPAGPPRAARSASCASSSGVVSRPASGTGQRATIGPASSCGGHHHERHARPRRRRPGWCPPPARHPGGGAGATDGR